MIDDVTQSWIRNRSDEMAAAAGCWFDPKRAAYVAWWIERYCKLYEGEEAGEPIKLHGCHNCAPAIIEGEWFNADGSENEEVVFACLERLHKHNECFHAGHSLDWQYECIVRLFGWLREAKKWGRPVRRFRRASMFVAKKNKKSPTLAAVAVYMTAGDGEPGQKVFLCAADGQQAREIAGKHVIEMVLQSDELLEDFTINKTLAQLTHGPSRSVLRPLSSNNSKAQKSKEGLNGSTFIDETHVVDREFIGRISRAGISRPEPLQAEFSTAGDNPDGYGQEQFDKAVLVIRGDVEDQGLFAAVYAAPQDLSDDDLDADPLKWGRMANPSMGHTVDPEEFLEDYHRSKGGSPEEFARFKMYRLNIWQRFFAAWISEKSWGDCKGEFTIKEMFGRICFVGLDLSKTTDPTAAVLLFPPLDSLSRWRLWPFFWIPEDTARQVADKVNFADWRRRGFIEFSRGGWIDYGVIRAKLNWIRDTFDLRCMGYDPKFSPEIVSALRSEDGWDESQVAEFGQTDVNFAAPTSEFHRMILAGEIEHPDNAMLNWQAGHVIAPENPRTRIRRAQRPKRDHRTVDGVVAGIMALGVAQANPIETAGSIYDTPGELAL